VLLPAHFFQPFAFWDLEQTEPFAKSLLTYPRHEWVIDLEAYPMTGCPVYQCLCQSLDDTLTPEDVSQPCTEKPPQNIASF
jgi:hypothetical protein